MDMDRRLYGKIVLRGKIKALTGLHIGAQREVSEIGGIDNPVIKDPITGLPYIPGSSLKGRLRALFEILTNSKLNEWKEKYKTLEKYKPGRCEEEGCGRFFNRRISRGMIHACDSYDEALECPVCRLFGTTGKETNFPSRIIVRDAKLTEEWVNRWREGQELTEAKIEVGIDRVTSQANPRTTERVVAGTEFDFEIIYNVEHIGQWEDDLKNLLTAMGLLEDSYLGGSGSRGYGKIKFYFEGCEFRSPKYYMGIEEAKVLDVKGKGPKEFLEEFENIMKEIKKSLEGE